MKYICRYYVVDDISETIVGSFDAVSNAMALEVFKRSILQNEKLNPYSDSFVIRKDPYGFYSCESYSDVMDRCSVVDFPKVKTDE